ncbi:hypothetical protein CC85DRAFT_158246 [Cutaneotrichosporon oleaginosum]|uniref:Uncharacterized protein n=1 Tax=Cutaneotrichosporon oleaginosum TaxID=879819 RepID=A0A0J1AY95_9TREE|nr:uncharacterized protein CC85DRAFT_158246 [Cutaneotrichosporon oleaginosum]KLT40299.1 hypothetical protein CC85DRAFT_158246 [Cutaneotrichosporon oleaginosum]TXT07988.1 hypothetical protein COLE_04912 [Cutaneotrichosporon oleaginosum]
MQRAAARAAKAEPLAPATSGSVSAPAASAPSTPASPAPASITPSQAATPIPAMSTPIPAAPADDEAGAKWVLPRRNAEAGPGPSTRPRVQFVASYLPFLEDEDDGPTGMASGRMAFGMGAKLEEARDGDDNDEDEFISDSEDDVAVRRDKKARAPVGSVTGMTDARLDDSSLVVSCSGPSRAQTSPNLKRRNLCNGHNREPMHRHPRRRSAYFSVPKASRRRLQERGRAKARPRTKPSSASRSRWTSPSLARPTRKARRSSTRRRARCQTTSTPSSRINSASAEKPVCRPPAVRQVLAERSALEMRRPLKRASGRKCQRWMSGRRSGRRPRRLQSVGSRASSASTRS